MSITVNGEIAPFTPEQTIAELLDDRGVGADAPVAVQRNGAFVAPGAFAETVLADGDVVEYLFFLGGGRP